MSEHEHDGTEVRRSQVPFALVPELLVFDERLSPGAVRLWLALDRYAGAEREAWPSGRTLARRLSVSRPTIARWLAELVDTGWIERRDRRRPDGSVTSPLLVLMGGTCACGGGTCTCQGGTSAFHGLNESQRTRVSERTTLVSQPIEQLVHEPAVQVVFDAWVDRARGAGVLSERAVTLTPGRREKIERRLREGYTVEQLVAAIDAALASEFHRSNARWCELSSILGSREKVDRHLTASDAGDERMQAARRVVAGAARIMSAGGE